MKTRSLAILLILIGWFVLAPSLLRAEENEYYQGQQGEWIRQGKTWRWESTHGDEWYEGKQGHWYQDQNGWHWYGNDGDDYGQGRRGWKWHRVHPKHDADRN